MDGVPFLLVLLLGSCIAVDPLLFVWPQPANFKFGSTALVLYKDSFTFGFADDSPRSPIIEEAFTRHSLFTFKYAAVPNFIDEYATPLPEAHRTLTKLLVSIESNDDRLYLGVDESYTLTIPDNENEIIATLKAKTIYGALHGLETFSQLIRYNGTHWLIVQAPIDINDAPRFAWRGLLLDTARHFHPVWSIKHVIDSMAYAKLNVLHWHITDSESFPLQLSSRPEMAEKGAWHPDHIYSAEDVAEIVEYAKRRGVRVLPEIDTPGHSYSWGHAHPDIILNCAQMVFTGGGYPGVNVVPLDMTNPKTYAILKDVYQEAASMFPDEYFHVGGDEVNQRCIDAFPRVRQWIRENLGSSDYKALLRYFRQNLTSYMTDVNKKMVVWHEAIEEMLGQPNNPLTTENTIAQVWAYARTVLDKVVRAGYKVVVSDGWYLDVQRPGTDRYFYQDTWFDFYKREPTDYISDQKMANQVIGGETCQWGETANPYNFDSHVWSRAAAVAERLWSPKQVRSEVSAQYRLLRFQCHLLQRGVRTSPFRPNHCPSPILDALAESSTEFQPTPIPIPVPIPLPVPQPVPQSSPTPQPVPVSQPIQEPVTKPSPIHPPYSISITQSSQSFLHTVMSSDFIISPNQAPTIFIIVSMALVTFFMLRTRYNRNRQNQSALSRV